LGSSQSNINWNLFFGSHFHTKPHKKALWREQVIKSSKKEGIKDQGLMWSRGRRVSDL
jgi:hypothetical protein